jgi:hypothetical protein
MVATTIASILLSLSIGALFIGQVVGLSKNLTTIESFVPNIEDNVRLALFSHRSIRGIGRRMQHRYSGINIGCCPFKPRQQKEVYDIRVSKANKYHSLFE